MKKSAKCKSDLRKKSSVPLPNISGVCLLPLSVSNKTSEKITFVVCKPPLIFILFRFLVFVSYSFNKHTSSLNISSQPGHSGIFVIGSRFTFWVRIPKISYRNVSLTVVQWLLNLTANLKTVGLLLIQDKQMYDEHDHVLSRFNLSRSSICAWLRLCVKSSKCVFLV